jgi:hypothetical protein
MGLYLRWTPVAVADSDSVNIVIKVFAKRSTTMDDGMNHLFIPNGNGAATDSSAMFTMAGDTAVVQRIPATYYVARNRNPKLKVLHPGVAHSIAVPVHMWRLAGNGGVYIPIEGFTAEYVGIEVTNAHETKNLNSFVAELWTRAN